MALIDCSECNTKISSHAASCPHCGNPLLPPPGQIEKIASETESVQIAVMSTAGTMAGFFGIIGFASVFFVPPVGIFLILLSGFLTLFAKNKVAGRQGYCPHCTRLISLPTSAKAGNCPFCKKRLVHENEKFVQA